LTTGSPVGRDEHLAHMLYALGHVLHLNQDTSQPDHVRNDAHYSKRWIENYGLNTYREQPDAFPTMNTGGWQWWNNNGFTKLKDFWDRGIYNGNASALDADANNGPLLGLAEFSNGNFLGEDAVYAEYLRPGNIHYFPYPSRDKSTDFPSLSRN